MSSAMGRQLLRPSGKRSGHTGESATIPAVSMEDKIIISSLTTLAELDRSHCKAEALTSRRTTQGSRS